MLWWCKHVGIVSGVTFTSAHDNVNQSKVLGGGVSCLLVQVGLARKCKCKWGLGGGGGVWWGWCVLGGCKNLVPPQYGQKHVSV